MNPSSVIPLVAAAFFLIYAVGLSAGVRIRNPWWVPALVSLLFLCFSAYAIVQEGPVGFWVEHTRNLWGNQIWFDLVLAVSVGWVFMVPRARAVGMHPLPWLALVVATGSIGFLAMLARLSYLEGRTQTEPGPRPSLAQAPSPR